MLLNLKTLAAEEELMDDEQLDKAIESFRPVANQIFDTYSETLKKIVESYIGTEKLQNKVSLDQAVEKFKTDFSQLSIAPKFEIKEMKSSTDDLNLGIFLKGVSTMPTLRIVLGRKETDNGQVLVNILSWGFNDYLYSVRDHKNAKLYLYLNTRKDLNRFLLQFAEALPQIWTAPK
jgi:hypothetical protein